MTTIELGKIYLDKITKRRGIAIAVNQSLYEQASVLLTGFTVGVDSKRVDEWYPVTRIKLDEDANRENWGDTLPNGWTVPISPMGR